MKILNIILAVAVSGIFWNGCARSSTSDSSNGTLSSNCLTVNATESEGKGVGIRQDTGGVEELLQSFTVNNDKEVNQIALKLKAVGAPSGILKIKIEGSSGDLPDGVAIVETSYAVQTIRNTDSKFYGLNFPDLINFKKGKTYWIRVSASYGRSDADHIEWSANVDNNVRDGSAYFNNTSGGDLQRSGVLNESYDFLYKVGCTD